MTFISLISCRTTNTGSNDGSSLQAWNNAQAIDVAKVNFRSVITSCVPKMANYIQAGRGEKVKRFLEVTRVDKFLDYILSRPSTKTQEVDSILRTYYESGQKNLDDCLGPVAEFVVLEFVNSTGLLRYGFGTKGEILNEPDGT